MVELGKQFGQKAGEALVTWFLWLWDLGVDGPGNGEVGLSDYALLATAAIAEYSSRYGPEPTRY